MTVDKQLKTILVVEDNLGHFRLFQEALKKCQVPHQAIRAKDGIEAMSFLRQEGNYVNAPHPDIILLDLNLPRKNGREVLAEIKSDPELKRIPVLVLTSSNNEQDILQTYDLHANCYLNKSNNRLSQDYGENSICCYKTDNGGLRRGLKLIGLLSKLSPYLTHPTKHKILLSPQVRESRNRSFTFQLTWRRRNNNSQSKIKI